MTQQHCARPLTDLDRFVHGIVVSLELILAQTSTTAINDRFQGGCALEHAVYKRAYDLTPPSTIDELHVDELSLIVALIGALLLVHRRQS